MPAFVERDNSEVVAAARVNAHQLGAEAIVVSALQLVETLFGTAVAPPAWSGRSWASRALADLSERALAAPADYASRPPLRWILRKLPVQFAMGVSMRYRYRFAQMVLLAPRDFDASGLPIGFLWLRLPLRPVMLLLRDRLGRASK